jgi:hypothetical protein
VPVVKRYCCPELVEMPRSFVQIFLIAVVTLLIGSATRAAGILPDRQNKVAIYGQFGNSPPTFLLVFSAQPLRSAQGNLLTRVSAAELAGWKNDRERLVLRVYGKQPSRTGQVEYHFGTGTDAAAPWNSGPDFRWGDWEQYTPDIWDNLSVVPLPAAGGPSRVTGVSIWKGGKALYDSRTRQSFPHGRPINAAFPPVDLASRPGEYPVLNLAERMEQFRREYYELGSSRILQAAYADLGQTDKRKYANRGNAWCSEFSSYIYRQCGLMTPDPNRSDVHWKSMREFFERSGHVYPARVVAGWSDERRRTLVKPGSFVSILLGNSTHSIIFTNWVEERGQPISKYVGISGNNRGMVWPHAPLKLPTPDLFVGMTPEALQEYDQKVYFAVPNGAP